MIDVLYLKPIFIWLLFRLIILKPVNDNKKKNIARTVPILEGEDTKCNINQKYKVKNLEYQKITVKRVSYFNIT